MYWHNFFFLMILDRGACFLCFSINRIGGKCWVYLNYLCISVFRWRSKNDFKKEQSFSLINFTFTSKGFNRCRTTAILMLDGLHCFWTKTASLKSVIGLYYNNILMNINMHPSIFYNSLCVGARSSNALIPTAHLDVFGLKEVILTQTERPQI